jgi:hypothetical protein
MTAMLCSSFLSHRPTRQRRQAGSAKGLIVMREDFDAPLDDFSEYMQ